MEPSLYLLELEFLDWIGGWHSGINCVTFSEIAGQDLKGLIVQQSFSDGPEPKDAVS
jgi:hypothetical protein